MENRKPLIAIVGSSRAEVVNDVDATNAACVELGKALANTECRIVVYSANPKFIEAQFIKGYINANTPAKDGSITCIYPWEAKEDFESLVANRKNLLNLNIDAADGWEVSFYKSLWKIDGIVIIGGGSSTLAAGYIAISQGLPIVAVPKFGGAASHIWKNLKQSSLPSYIKPEEIDKMATWTEDSPKTYIESLCNQFNQQQREEQEKEAALKELRRKAEAWDKDELTLNREREQREKQIDSIKIISAIVFSLIFVFLFWKGISVTSQTELSTVFVIGLAVAGGTGATIRMLLPSPPKINYWRVPVAGCFIGFLFSVLYLVPQIIGNTSFLNPEITLDYTAVRVLYMSVMVFAASIGFSFDFAVKQLQKRGQQLAEQEATVSDKENPQSN